MKRTAARMSRVDDGFVCDRPEMETRASGAPRAFVSKKPQDAHDADRKIDAPNARPTATYADTTPVGHDRGFDSNLSTGRAVKGVQTGCRLDSTAVCYDVRSSSSSLF